jgi:hypothetical protein
MKVNPSLLRVARITARVARYDYLTGESVKQFHRVCQQFVAAVIVVWISIMVIKAGPPPVPLDTDGHLASPTDYPWDGYYLR